MIGWLDASSGASGDMLLGALVGAGVPLEVLQEAVDRVSPERVTLRTERVTRGGFAATRCHVEVSDSVSHRTWREVSGLLRHAGLERAHEVFERLAVAEAAVHGTEPERVHFHEVGALDAIADVVAACAGVEHLALDPLVVSPVAVGSGSVGGAHGRLPVPAPAVAELLRGVPSYAGPGSSELCTPTGAALLTSLATSYGPQPAMVTGAIGVGAGDRDPQTHANVLRLLVGVPAPQGPAAGTPQDGPLLLETNVDDLDPRLWPGTLQALLDAGASDAWLTPILMKKGRPAHTLSVLVAPDRADAVRRQVFRHTTTLGLRERPVAKTALERSFVTVRVEGHELRVKLGLLDGEVVNAQPEYDDVAAVAARMGRPPKDVLAAAVAAARSLLGWTQP